MIAIIDYGLGNLGSIANMLKKVKAEAIISSDIAEIERAEKLILPGVGAFDIGMRNLRDRGMLPMLNRRVLQDRTPILGLCLGMQLFTCRSEEGNLPGLGWIDADTVRFHLPNPSGLKIPHMGWNQLRIKQPSPVLKGLDTEETRFYFVHSFHAVCRREEDILATTVYGYEFPSMVGRANIVGTQFHPEKSHRFGMKLLENFVNGFPG